MNFKDLKSIFVEEEPSVEKKKQAGSKTPKPEAKSNPVVSTSSTIISDRNMDTAMVDKLLKAFADNNLDGFDYFEYKQTLSAMQKMSMDEKTRYQSAFASASTMGVSVEHLINSVDHYLKVLDKEKADFNRAIVQTKTSKIQEPKALIESIKKASSEKLKQIDVLKQSIEEDKKKIENLKADISKKESLINDREQTFAASLNHLKAQIEGDLAKMKQHLK